MISELVPDVAVAAAAIACLVVVLPVLERWAGTSAGHRARVEDVPEA